MDIESRKTLLFQLKCSQKIEKLFWVNKDLVNAYILSGNYGGLIIDYLNGKIQKNDTDLAIRIGAIRKELEYYLASVIVGFVAGYINTIDPTTRKIIRLCCEYEKNLDLSYTLAKERIVFDIAEHFSTFDHNSFYIDSLEARHAFDTYLFLDNSFQNNYHIIAFFRSINFEIEQVKRFEILKNLISMMEGYISASRSKPVDKEILGLHSFLDFSYDLYKLFETITNYPLLQSIIWCRYSYYFEFYQSELKYLTLLLKRYYPKFRYLDDFKVVLYNPVTDNHFFYSLEHQAESYIMNLENGCKALKALSHSSIGSHFMQFVNRGEAAVPIKT